MDERDGSTDSQWLLFTASRGLAKLLKNVENRLYEMGIGIIACLVEEWNTGSMQFFEKMEYSRHHDIIYFTKRKYPDV